MKRVKFFSITAALYFCGCIFTIPREYLPIHKDGRKIPLYEFQDKERGISRIYHKYRFYSKVYERFMVTITHTRKQKNLA